MKPIFTAVSLLLTLCALSANTFAADAAIFCKVDGRVLNALVDEDGWMCRDALLTVDTEEACFTGDRSAAINILNDLEMNGFFDGTDGNFIKDAHFKGKNSISYTIVDDVNAFEDKSSFERCEAEFFTQQ